MSHISTKSRVTTLAVLFAFLMMMMANTGAMAAAKPLQQKTAFVQGTTSAGDLFSGVFTLTNFVNQNGQLVAQGVLNGTLTSAAGAATAVTNQAVTIPVSSVAAGCPILNLVLGPVDLNLLGLTIHLNQVVLNIIAVPGSGNLLGNLLCAVAHLLDGLNLSAILDQLVNLLNQIIAAL